ncbi:MAG: CAF17-like 4Fe-4S cluster assembly/insertion protein YgfZ, partial [Planctomycetota bacterium]
MDLTACQQRRGAAWEETGGRRVLRSYGDAQGEREALATGAGLLHRAHGTVVAVTGADRVDYLHRMVTQDVASLEPGRAAYACVLTARGRILGDPLIWCDEDALLLTMDGAAAAASVPALERTVIMDEVTFTDLGDDHAHFSLVGPASLDAVSAICGAAPAPGCHVRTRIGVADVRLLRRDFGARPGFDLLVAAADAAGVFDRSSEAPGVRPVGEEAWDAARVEEGVPAYGAELSDDVMPLEARLDDVALSWTKGCYPGQEPVVMAKHRGHPANLLVRLAPEGEPMPAAGAALAKDGTTVGRLTTVARTAVGPRALGYVRFSLAKEGTTLELP